MDKAEFRRLVLESRRRARAAVRRGSEEGFDAAILEDPNCAWRRDAELDRFSGRGEFARALRRVEALLARRRLPWLLAARGELLRLPAFGRYREAIRDLDEAARLAPEAAWIAAFVGRARFHGGEKRSGLGELGRAIRLAPRMGWAYAWRGEALRQEGKTRAALADFSRAAKLAPAYPWTLAWRAGALSALGRHREALRDLELFFAVKSAYPWAYRQRARARRRLGLIPEALADMRRIGAGELNPVVLGAGAEEEALLKESERDLGRWLRIRPKDARARAWRGEARVRLGLYKGGLEDLDRALSIEDFAWARVWRAEALCGLGRLDEARAALPRSVEYPRAHALRGWLERRAGDFAGAARAFGRAAAGPAPAAWCLALHGEALLESGRLEEAEAELSRALELHPRYPDALCWRAEARRRAGRIAEAIADFDAALAVEPGHLRARRGRGLAACAAGDFRSSARDLAGAI
jgi:tetratricopeptide (TPR) repeat protein